MEIHEMIDQDEFCRLAAEIIKTAGREAVRERGRFTLVLTGGRSVQPLYRYLADCSSKPEFHDLWLNTFFFLGDERWVAVGHPDSNGAMVRRLLLSPMQIKDDHILLIPTPPVFRAPADGAAAYEETLRGFFAYTQGQIKAIPEFDLILLSMGSDGHIASLFPDSEALRERECWVTVSSISDSTTQSSRVTMTLPVLNRGRNVMVMAVGRKKVTLARRVLAGAKGGSANLPVGMINSKGRTIWLLADD